MSDSPVSSSRDVWWNTACGKLPKEEIVYFCQVVVIFGVVIACIVNLSLGSTDKDSLWASLLSASVGYLLPSPKIRKHIKDESLLPHPTEQQL